jgi:DNA polymerase III sliding clamp (beta) subunit (PCNA family)
MSLISKMPADEELSIKQKKGSIVLKRAGASSKSSATLQTGDASSYPDFVPQDFREIGSPTNLAKCIKFCAEMIDLSARNQFPGVAFRGSYAYSTDGLRATRVTMDDKIEGGLIYVPASSAKSLGKLPTPSKLIQWQNMVGALFDDPPGLWCSATLSGRFPADAIDGFFADEPAVEFVAEFPEDVLPALDRLEVMTGEESEGIEVVSNDKHLYFVARVREGGELVEDFEWNFGHDFKIRLNPRHFRYGLQISSRVDLSQACGENARQIRFLGDGIDHTMALMYTG